jgi:putative ABC transport system permease protein
MNILVIFRIAFRALARNKMRSALTMLGIVIGVSAVIAMVSIGQGAQASVQEQIANVGTNLLFVGAGSQNVGGVRSGTGATSSNRLTVEDIEAIRREIPTVAMASPTVNTRAQLIFGNQNWNTQVQGVNEQFPQIKKWDVASGEFFTEGDVRTAARVIVLGQTVAESLYPGTDPVGQTVRVRELPFRVVGVMKAKGQDAGGRDQDDTAFAPFTAVQKKLLSITYVQFAHVSAISPEATYSAQEQITELLRQRHKLAPNEENDFFVRNLTDVAEGRHRHHEHHACLGDRAHARDRHPHGRRRALVGRPHAIPDRINRAQPDRRRDRNLVRHNRLVRDPDDVGLAHAHLISRHRRLGDLLRGGRSLLRLLSGAQSGRP